MNFCKYIKDKINYILAFIVYNIIISLYLNAIDINITQIMFVILISVIFFIMSLFFSYTIKNKYIKNIEKMMDNLDEKYLISEIWRNQGKKKT